MCGICGRYERVGGRPADRAVVERMTAAIAHRGPDDEGFHVRGRVGLGFRRLSIIDIEGGHQPMADESGRVWVVFNGEIYNFRELRRELESHGHHFRTRSDTEVVLRAYQQWGLDCLIRFNGMFGLAVWDEDADRLVLARDRAGIKPLYYHLGDDALVFGSELRAVLAGLATPPALDPVAVDLFLRYRYVPAPLTVHAGVAKLAPGTCLVMDRGQARVETWWRYEPRPFEPMPSAARATRELDALYQEAVTRQLVSDVPLGLLLSGGVDSALLLALMNERARGWATFTVGFGTSYADDELDDARRTAAALGSTHTDVVIDRTSFEASLASIVDILEEPVASASVVPMYFVCQRARQDVTVALMGQGPDELFGGYKRHLGVRYAETWRRLPDPLRRVALRLPAAARSETLRRAAHALEGGDRLDRVERTFSLLPGDQVDALFRPGVLDRDPGAELARCWENLIPLTAAADELSAFSYLEVRSSLPDELLLYADKLSMHHGLEIRVPFLDHEVIEYATRLAPSLKVRRGRRKWLHKQVAAARLPVEITRRRKRGFAVNVVSEWFENSVGGGMAEQLRAPDARIYEVLQRDGVERMLRQHQDGTADHHKMLFSLVVLETWLQSSSGACRPACS